MLSYLVRRLVGTVPVIFMISLFVFLLLQSAPGDPADILISDQASPEDIADARKRWGQRVYEESLTESGYPIEASVLPEFGSDRP